MRPLIAAALTTLATLTFITPSAPARQSQPAAEIVDVAGTWDGEANVLGQKLRMIFNVTRDEQGNLLAHISIPAQMVRGMAIDEVTLEGDALVFAWKTVNARWELDISDDGRSAEGVLKQNGMEFPVTLRRLAEGEVIDSAANRPQTPKPPFPYQTTDVEFTSAGDNVKLAGTICMPEGEGPHPAVVFITGSGPQDRDETLFDHKPFLVLADDLARHGIASLRYDDRGVGGSGGDLGDATVEVFKGDVLGAIDLLRRTPGIDPRRIGLIGHSEGGIVAPAVAAESEDLAFIVLLAGTGVSGDEVLRVQTRALLEASGAAPTLVAQTLADQKKMLGLIGDPARREELFGHMRETVSRQMPGLEGAALEEMVNAQVEMVSSPWFVAFVKHDPRPALRRVTCPVLALNGDLDLQVLPSQNLPEIRAALEEAGNTDVTIRELPRLNHLFQECERGTIDEYGQIEQTMHPRVIQMIREWIVSRAGLTSE